MHSTLKHNNGERLTISRAVAYPGILFWEGGVQQIQLKTERTGILGAIAL